MKKIIAVFTVLISIFSAIVPMSSLAVTIDDVKSDTESIKSTVEDNNSTVYDIWNYINNALMPAIQNSGGANNATKDDINDVKNSMADESEKGVESYFKKKDEESKDEKETAKNSVNNISEGVQKASNTVWETLTIAFKTGNLFGYNIDATSYSRGSLFDIFKIFGYSLVLVFFAVNLIETTIKYEIFTLRGAVNIFGRLIVSKIIIDMSGKVCVAIIKANSHLTSQILGDNIRNINLNAPHINLETSKIWAVGPIVDFILAIIIGLPIIINLLVILVVSSLVIIKLIFRSFEMAMLVTVSPAFFACYSSEVTKPYFRNFILTFIQVSAQIVFMAVVYYIGADKITGQAVDINGISDLVIWFQRTIPNTLIIVAMCIMMIKPPRVLTSLVR